MSKKNNKKVSYLDYNFIIFIWHSSIHMHGRHKTLDKHLKPSIHWLEKLPGVSKIILGFCEACRHKYAPGTIRWRMDVEGGFKANGYSGNGVIDLFIRVDPIELREAIKHSIAARF